MWTSKSSSITRAWKQAPFPPPHQGTDEKQELRAEARMNRWPVFYMPLIWLIYLDLLGCINILFLSLRVGIQDDQAPACYHIRFPTIVFFTFFTTILYSYTCVTSCWDGASWEQENQPLELIVFFGKRGPPSLCRFASTHAIQKKSENAKSAPDVAKGTLSMPGFCMNDLKTTYKCVDQNKTSGSSHLYDMEIWWPQRRHI